VMGMQVLVDGWGSVGNVWRVPEMGRSDDIGNSIKVKEEFEGNDGWKMRHREASVLRYKEKRQNRLFSKRIRYEVRKLNAEKRPRMKVTTSLALHSIFSYTNWNEFFNFSLMQCFNVEL
jgi:hypothetical protein